MFSQPLIRNGVVVTLALGLVAFLAIKQAAKAKHAAQPADSPQVPRPALAAYLAMIVC